MTNQNLKKLIAYLAAAASECGITGEPSEAADLLVDLASRAGAAADESVEILDADILAAPEPEPLRVLAACLRYENDVWDFMCSLPDPLNDPAWRLIDELRTEAIGDLSGYEHWSEE